MQKKKGITVMSLFDGVSCGMVALERLGIKVDNYYSSEIDKYAEAISKYQYPNIIRLGDVKHCLTYLRGEIMQETGSWKDDYGIDLLFAGFPCQSFSIAGNRKGFDDERGNLFFDLMRTMKEVKPKYFLFENVASMKKTDRAKLDEIIGVKSVMINSALVSAQQRKRLYWTNIEGFGEKDLFSKRQIGQPKDKGIYLKDVLESGVAKNMINNKSITIKKQYAKNGRANFINGGTRSATCVYEKPVRIGHIGKGSQAERIYDPKGKSVCLSAKGGGGGAKTGLYAIAQRGRNIVDGKRKDIKGAKTQQRFETSYSEKSNCLTSVQKDSLILDGCSIRKLTPLECERLQTLPDNYTAKGIMEGKEVKISNTRRYMACGNGWTVDVISHILKGIKK